MKLLQQNPWFNQWLSRRVPRRDHHVLGLDNLFIFPTRTGLLFLLLTLFVWIMGTNFQNNLIVAVAYFLLSLNLVCIALTHANLSGIEVRVVKSYPGFAGGLGQVDLCIQRHSEINHEAIRLHWPGGNSVNIGLSSEPKEMVQLTVPLPSRGLYQPPQLIIESTFPLGLLTAWSKLDLRVPILVYPRPISAGLTLQTAPNRNEAADWVAQEPDGDEEFSGLRQYTDGDSLRRIDWKASARGQGLTTRLFDNPTQRGLWLDWRQLPEQAPETRLSHLCAAVLEHTAPHIQYGLKLPGLTIGQGAGREHRDAMLKALALFHEQPA